MTTAVGTFTSSDPVTTAFFKDSVVDSKCSGRNEKVGLWRFALSDQERADSLDNLSILPSGEQFAFQVSSWVMQGLVDAQWNAKKINAQGQPDPNGSIRLSTSGHPDPNGDVQLKSYELFFQAHQVNFDVHGTVHISPGIDPDFTVHYRDKITVENQKPHCVTSKGVDTPDYLHALSFLFTPLPFALFLENTYLNPDAPALSSVGCLATRVLLDKLYISGGLKIDFAYDDVLVDESNGIVGYGTNLFPVNRTPTLQITGPFWAQPDGTYSNAFPTAVCCKYDDTLTYMARVDELRNPTFVWKSGSAATLVEVKPTIVKDNGLRAISFATVHVSYPQFPDAATELYAGPVSVTAMDSDGLAASGAAVITIPVYSPPEDFNPGPGPP
ncbi:MAG: hypothetical protein WAU32_07065 [Thermoanaerobaculia bacterium]